MTEVAAEMASGTVVLSVRTICCLASSKLAISWPLLLPAVFILVDYVLDRGGAV